MAYFYHATTREKMFHIVGEGKLRANAFGEVFLCKEPIDACKFLVCRGITRISVIEIELDESDVVVSDDHSESYFQCQAFIHNGDIEITGDEKITDYIFDTSEGETGGE